MKSIKKNYIYNLVYQVFVLLAPLITTPYVSRVLGAEKIGEYSYMYSVAYYFVLAAILGTATYAEREVSFYQDNREERSVRFWDLFFLRVITSITSMGMYVTCVVVGCKDERMAIIVSLNIVAVMVDTIWLFQGMEEFRQITLRNLFVKIVTIILIFVFVNEREDIYKYALIMSGSPVVSAICLLPFAHKYIDKPQLKKIHPFKDLKNIIGLFIPTIAISIYTVLDVTMLGLFTSTKVENGYYEQATKLSKTALTMVTALGTVMIPRISYYFEKKKKDMIEKYMLKSYSFAFALGIPICFGLIGISDNLVPWFYGTGYEKVAVLLKISSFLIIAIGLSNITGMQYLVPTKQQNKLTYSVLVGAIVNFGLNMVLIPKWYSVGATIASVIAEFAVTITQFIFVRKQLRIREISYVIPKYIISGVIMLCLLEIERHFLPDTMYATMLMIISGGGIYFIALLIRKDEFLIDFIDKFKLKRKING